MLVTLQRKPSQSRLHCFCANRLCWRMQDKSYTLLWSSHEVRFCERRVKFKLASPLYSDHPYNVFGLGRGIWTPDVLVPNQTLYQTEPYLENCVGDCNQTSDKLIIIGQFSKNNSHHVKVYPLWVSWWQELNLQHHHYKWGPLPIEIHQHYNVKFVD